MKNFKRKALPALALLAGASMSLAGVTYAWFNQNTEAKVNNIKVGVQDAEGGFAIGDTLTGSYGNEIKYNDPAGGKGHELKPISTNGRLYGVTDGQKELKFFAGTVSTTNTEYLDNSVAVTDQLDNYVFKKDIYFENTSASTKEVRFNFTKSYEGALTGLFKTTVTSENVKTILDKSILSLRIAFVVHGTYAKKDSSSTFTPSDSVKLFEPQYKEHYTTDGVTTGDAVVSYNALIAPFTTTEGANPSHKINTLEENITEVTTPLKIEDYCFGGEELFEAPTGYTHCTYYIFLEGQDTDNVNDVAGTDLFEMALNFKSNDKAAA